MRIGAWDAARGNEMQPAAPRVRRLLRMPAEDTLRLLALGAIVALAAVLRFANLSELGLANHYYTAAVSGMLHTWRNFFFVAAEPGGSVSIDKPPVGLWLQALSVFFLGVNTLGVLLPQILAGMLSVIVLYHLVQRRFGATAGLVAALALAITPIVVATDRNNTIDSTLILTLLLAAWAFIKATEGEHAGRYLLLGAALVGIGFNIKMLQAYLPLPAFYVLYFFGSTERVWRKIGRLALATGLLLAISLSWSLIVDLTPAGQRPYVGSSSDNSELSLIVGYNGLERLLGMGFGRGSNGSGLLAGLVSGSSGVRTFQAPAGTRDGGRPLGARDGQGFAAAPPDGNGAAFGGGFQGGPGSAGFPGGGFTGGAGGPAGGGFPGTGRPGALRLFTPPLSKETSWLLPFGLFGLLLVTLRTRLRWPIAPRHQYVVLWGGWLLTGAIFFSVAGFFHEYYLAMLAAPLAALVGMGVAEMWRIWQGRWPLALALALLAAGGTLAFQYYTTQAFVPAAWWWPMAAALFVAGAILALAAGGRRPGLAGTGLAAIVAAMLLTPAIWSALTTINASANQSLPAAYSGRPSGPVNRGSLQVNQTLVDYLQARTQGVKYLMAVPSSMQGADYVLATGRPVLYLGGFMGQDQVETPASLAQLVANGELRFVYWDGRGSGPRGAGGQSDVTSWVASTCTPVEGFETTTQNSGAPDGTRPGQGTSTTRGFGGMQVTLYDCQGAGANSQG